MDFKYLDNLIRTGKKEIILTSDIILGDAEDSEYVNGIKLDADYLIIEGNGHTIDARRKARIFHNTGNVLIRNIVLKNALGAVYNFRGTVKISRSRLADNVCEVAGAAIYNSWGEVSLEEVELTGNVSGCHGGAIFSVNGTVNIKNSKLTANTAENDGGAIYNGSRLNIENSLLSDNSAGRAGGAVYDNRGEITIQATVLSENTSNGIFGGGAIHKNRGELIIDECKLSGNASQSDGGAIFSIDGEIAVKKSVFSHNKSRTKGGAIYDWGVLEITGSEISKNASGDGGGIYSKNRNDLSVRDCRIKDNVPNDIVR